MFGVEKHVLEFWIQLYLYWTPLDLKKAKYLHIGWVPRSATDEAILFIKSGNDLEFRYINHWLCTHKGIRRIVVVIHFCSTNYTDNLEISSPSVCHNVLCQDNNIHNIKWKTGLVETFMSICHADNFQGNNMPESRYRSIGHETCIIIETWVCYAWSNVI